MCGLRASSKVTREITRICAFKLIEVGIHYNYTLEQKYQSVKDTTPSI